MIVCGKCRKQYGEDMGFCPFCGYDTPPETERKKSQGNAEQQEDGDEFESDADDESESDN